MDNSRSSESPAKQQFFTSSNQGAMYCSVVEQSRRSYYEGEWARRRKQQLEEMEAKKQLGLGQNQEREPTAESKRLASDRITGANAATELRQSQRKGMQRPSAKSPMATQQECQPDMIGVNKAATSAVKDKSTMQLSQETDYGDIGEEDLWASFP